MTMFLIEKKIPWRSSDCGGAEIHGQQHCLLVEDKRVCFCKPTPVKNFVLWNAIAQACYICKEKPYEKLKGCAGIITFWMSFS